MHPMDASPPTPGQGGRRRVVLPSHMYGGTRRGDLSASSPSSSLRRHTASCTCFSALQLLCGTYLFWQSSAFMTGASYGRLSSGHMSALTLIAVGALGVVGARLNSKNVLTAHLVGVLFSIMLGFYFHEDMYRQATVDCSFAALQSRMNALEVSEAKSRQEHLFSALLSRIDKVEGMLDGVEKGKLRVAELMHKQHELKATDQIYIHSKLEMLRSHAHEAFSQVAQRRIDNARALKLPNTTVVDDSANGEHADDKATPTTPTSGLTPKTRGALGKEQDILLNYLNTTEQILGRVEQHNQGKLITIEEYASILDALTNIFSENNTFASESLSYADNDADRIQLAEAVREMRNAEGKLKDLAQATTELPNMNAAMSRLTGNKYFSIGMDKEVSLDLEAEQRKRAAYREEFMDFMSRARTDRNAGGLINLQDMPAHCIQEQSALRSIRNLAVVVICFQVLCAYCAMALLFRIPVKEE